MRLPDLLAHPLPRPYRRVLYAVMAVIMTLAWWGTYALQGAGPIVTVLFAASAGLCAVGVIRVDHRTVWWVSRAAVFGGFVWRLCQIIAIEAGWSEQSPPDSSATAASVYIFAAGAVFAVWYWLTPGGGNGRQRVGGLADDE